MFDFYKVGVAAIGLATGCHVLAVEPGQVDDSFGSMGNGHETVAFLPGFASATASTLAPDGTIYIGGSVLMTPDKIDIGVTRLMPDGEFDASYGAVQIAVPGYAMAGFSDLVLQPDGKLIGVGLARNADADRFLICRLRVDGTLDDTFGDVQTPGCSSPLAGRATTVELQSDGRIVVAGSDDLGDPLRAVMFRLTQNGLVDTSFAANKQIALLSEELVASSTFNDIVITPDDGIALAGTYGPTGDQQFMVAKFTADGVLRPEFSQDGVRLVNYALMPAGKRRNVPDSLAVLADGSVIVSGIVDVPGNNGGTPRTGVVKLKPDGNLSPDFQSPDFPNGQLLIDPCVQNCAVYPAGMEVMRDGRILIAGSAHFGAPSVSTLYSMRLLPNGQLDASYVANNAGEFAPGVSLASWDGFDPQTMVMQGDRIVMLGNDMSMQDQSSYGALRLVGEAMFADGLESN